MKVELRNWCMPHALSTFIENSETEFQTNAVSDFSVKIYKSVLSSFLKVGSRRAVNRRTWPCEQATAFGACQSTGSIAREGEENPD